jgi:anaerobic magnesium-protoporphyrin IX monomethyl ester cyclase
MSTVFIKPNAKKKQYGQVMHLAAIEPPVWLALLAKGTPEALIIDMEAENLDADGLVSRLKGRGFQRAVVLATGSHPSAHIQQTETAERLKPLLEGAFGITVEVYSHLPFNPIEAGAIDWSLLPVEQYRAHNWHSWGRKDKSYGATFTSISCPFHCEFCCVKDFYRSEYRQRAPELVAADIASAVKLGVTNFKLMDELFAVENQGVHAVLDRLIVQGLGEEINIWAYARIDTVNEKLLQKMRRAGVRWLAYGIESGDQEIRSEVDKGSFTNQKIHDVIRMTKNADINALGNYMFGFWEDDIRSMNETLDLARKLNCEYANFYCMTVYPGSRLYNEMKARGVDLPRHGVEFSQMSPRFKPVPTSHLKAGEVLRFRDQAFRDYFGSERYLSMMRSRFGEGVVTEIKDMLKIDIRS